MENSGMLRGWGLAQPADARWTLLPGLVKRGRDLPGGLSLSKGTAECQRDLSSG